jgi:hypothetical protein
MLFTYYNDSKELASLPQPSQAGAQFTFALARPNHVSAPMEIHYNGRYL